MLISIFKHTLLTLSRTFVYVFWHVRETFVVVVSHMTGDIGIYFSSIVKLLAYRNTLESVPGANQY